MMVMGFSRQLITLLEYPPEGITVDSVIGFMQIHKGYSCDISACTVNNWLVQPHLQPKPHRFSLRKSSAQGLNRLRMALYITLLEMLSKAIPR